MTITPPGLVSSRTCAGAPSTMNRLPYGASVESMRSRHSTIGGPMPTTPVTQLTTNSIAPKIDRP
jgi:hypothetical protein